MQNPPTLKNVLTVENVLRNSDLAVNKTDLIKKVKIADAGTFNLILNYLEKKGMIMNTHKGIVWTYNPNPKFQTAVDRGIEV